VFKPRLFDVSLVSVFTQEENQRDLFKKLVIIEVLDFTCTLVLKEV
jgi:hypothetical protein